MHRAAAAEQPGVLTKVGLDSFVDPALNGGRMNDATPAGHRARRRFRRPGVALLPVHPRDVAIIRATTADENGNLTCEDEGSPLGALDQASPPTTTAAW